MAMVVILNDFTLDPQANMFHPVVDHFLEYCIHLVRRRELIKGDLTRVPLNSLFLCGTEALIYFNHTEPSPVHLDKRKLETFNFLTPFIRSLSPVPFVPRAR
ncbi:hypothetical protein C0J52_18869 [Blattella germanica]|nr:hypothetical protein C0J52_18869 [Blattella germanica]